MKCHDACTRVSVFTNDGSMLLDGSCSCYSGDWQKPIQNHIDSKHCILVFSFKAQDIVVEWQLNTIKICPAHAKIIGDHFMFLASLRVALKCYFCRQRPCQFHHLTKENDDRVTFLADKVQLLNIGISPTKCTQSAQDILQ